MQGSHLPSHARTVFMDEEGTTNPATNIAEGTGRLARNETENRSQKELVTSLD